VPPNPPIASGLKFWPIPIAKPFPAWAGASSFFAKEQDVSKILDENALTLMPRLRAG
jgi:hypothetical protein